jgi:hypothetical protein
MKGVDVIPVKLCYNRGESRRTYAVLWYNALKLGGIELVHIDELC